MEASIEDRLRSVEERLERVEEALRARPEPTAAAPPVWPPAPRPAPRAAPPRREPSQPRAQAPSLEEVFGGRVLAWLGGAAVVLGVVFFLVMAVSRGWIDEPTRVVLAFAGSTALLALALWLHERKGRTQASLAAAAAALASLYASLTVGTVVYGVIPDAAGFAVAGLVGAAGAAIAVRWRSQVVAGIGILGALLAPVLVDAGTSWSSLAFMAIALAAAVAVLVWQRWPWLSFLAFVVSVPQLLDWVADRQGWVDGGARAPVGPTLAVLFAFWLLWVVGALGNELRAPTEKLRVSSALLLFSNVLVAAGAGWAVLHDAHRPHEATAWVLALAAGHVVLGATTMRGRISRQVGALLVALGTSLSAIGLALALSGPALVAGWAAEAALLAWLARRTDDERATVGGAAFLALALGHVLLFEARPDALATGLDHPAKALVGLALVAASAAVSSRFAVGRLAPWRETLEGLVAVVVLYGCSVAIVDASGATRATGTTQSGQLLLSAFWSVVGLAGVVAGLARDRRRLRLGGLSLLGVAIVKVFLVDLATLESIYRVGSFIGLGLLLIAGAFAYQRVRHEAER